jgi:hypothetical protein
MNTLQVSLVNVSRPGGGEPGRNRAYHLQIITHQVLRQREVQVALATCELLAALFRQRPPWPHFR